VLNQQDDSNQSMADRASKDASSRFFFKILEKGFV
jgi:hypothetical protein